MIYPLIASTVQIAITLITLSFCSPNKQTLKGPGSTKKMRDS